MKLVKLAPVGVVLACVVSTWACSSSAPSSDPSGADVTSPPRYVEITPGHGDVARWSAETRSDGEVTITALGPASNTLGSWRVRRDAAGLTVRSAKGGALRIDASHHVIEATLEDHALFAQLAPEPPRATETAGGSLHVRSYGDSIGDIPDNGDPDCFWAKAAAATACWAAVEAPTAPTVAACVLATAYAAYACLKTPYCANVSSPGQIQCNKDCTDTGHAYGVCTQSGCICSALPTIPSGGSTPGQGTSSSSTSSSGNPGNTCTTGTFSVVCNGTPLGCASSITEAWNMCNP